MHGCCRQESNDFVRSLNHAHNTIENSSVQRVQDRMDIPFYRDRDDRNYAMIMENHIHDHSDGCKRRLVILIYLFRYPRLLSARYFV